MVQSNQRAFLIGPNNRMVDIYASFLGLPRGQYRRVDQPETLRGLTSGRVFLIPGFETQPLALFMELGYCARDRRDVQIEYVDEADYLRVSNAQPSDYWLLPVISHFEEDQDWLDYQERQAELKAKHRRREQQRQHDTLQLALIAARIEFNEQTKGTV